MTNYESFTKLSENFSEGVFLVTKADGKTNVMLVGWPMMGRLFRKDVIMIPIRKSRYSHDFLEKNGDFTLCVPKVHTILEERNVCGTKSGRDMDKIEELGFTMADSDEIDVPYIKECEMCYECSTVMVTEMEGSEFDAEVKDKFYADGDYHTMYFAEIKKIHING